RFEREGRTISSLGHSNICALYDIGSDNSAESGAIDYLVLEFLEGETLDARLVRGPLPIDQALRCAGQICEALDAGHRRRRTHRDLNPGNVMLTPAGVKLLDFGLAKPQSAVASGSAAGETVAVPISGTMGSKPLTTAGTILGTIQYMAPEQIEGRDADA